MKIKIGVAGIILIIISYLGHFVFNQGVKKCGHGETWPFYIGSIFQVCIETTIPHPITKPFFWLGILVIAISIIIWIIEKKSKDFSTNSLETLSTNH